MANVVINDFHLMNIAENIRLLNGESPEREDGSRGYKPREMADAILRIPTFPKIVLTESQGQYFNHLGTFDDVITKFSDKITTKNLVSCLNMFYKSTLETIPIEINGKMISTADFTDLKSMFDGCYNLKEIPKIKARASELTRMFYGCYSLRNLPDSFIDDIDCSYLSSLTSGYSGSANGMFQLCYSLRSIPVNFFSGMNPKANYNYSYFYNGFENCCALDELVGLPVPYTGTWTSNGFYYSFQNCGRLKELIFATQNGSPYVVNWKSQTIDLSSYVGYVGGLLNEITSRNSGITVDKKVTDDATYQALKDDADWFTADINYSRYNHDSAVNTINSLPDASAYIADKGGTNTIKFKGESGSKTDGGAINTLTEEEIAVATAKGWTVTLV